MSLPTLVPGSKPDRSRLLAAIARYGDAYPEETDVGARFQAFVQAHERCFENDLWAGHITGSAWVVDPAGERTLLTHHKKLGRWLQLGGHSDGDHDTWRVAQREAEEESGLVVTLHDEAIFDLDVHAIPARKDDPEHWHFDVRFAFRALDTRYSVSEESNDLAWVPVGEVAGYTDEWSVLRMAQKWIL